MSTDINNKWDKWDFDKIPAVSSQTDTESELLSTENQTPIKTFVREMVIFSALLLFISIVILSEVGLG